eukprot:CAMPEP_0177790922 /NCGR_PEP_ID=MMETSP0491_2-20121128/23633_1 /TAXON_ID=63592 /ORGANISM="Tetraselmis chuii, Strain PLY429" /LENGTH=73 /DNA_ID=CAMNT_0019313069 /DNA_START=357 /DNA_END=578 /DNA_ORIENTATION=-
MTLSAFHPPTEIPLKLMIAINPSTVAAPLSPVGSAAKMESAMLQLNVFRRPMTSTRNALAKFPGRFDSATSSI